MTDLTDYGECSDCKQLPENWICAKCYIKDGKDIDTSE